MPSVNHQTDVLKVTFAEIDEEGNVTKRFPRIDAEGQLKNTVLHKRYPEILVTILSVPTLQLDAYEEARVRQALERQRIDGVEYRLVGASGSAKDGKFYAVDAKHERPIAERFQKWPQAAITYFGILVSDCRVVIEEQDAHILVVEDHALGTNDCRGWISERLFGKLNLPDHCFYQFRLAFDSTQAKGCFKVMGNDVATALEADIVLPESCLKPKLELGLLAECQKLLAGLCGDVQGTRFRSPIVLGIRDVSRELQFKSSYTLIEHAPADSLQTEIIPRALEEVRSVVSAALAGDYRKLLEVIGTSTAQGKVQDSESDEYTSYESSVVEAILKADSSGSLVRHPYLNARLQQLLVKWAFKAATGGGFRIPAFALTDDGYLFVHDGRLFAGSDWIPTGCGIGSLSSRKGLVIRYPIRMKEDLLPVELLSSESTVQILEHSLRSAGCGMDSAQIADLVDRQLRLRGTFVLHSKTAEQNGGDFDFDLVAVLQESEFPRFVRSRFEMREEHRRQKDKQKKVKSPWWNLADVAMKARGNQIGRITNLISDSIAHGRLDYAHELVDQLQNALDALKHNVVVDHAVIKRIRSEVPKAPWRDAKEARRISEMPMDFPVCRTDVVGRLYNHVRKEIGILFEETLPLRDFGGMIRGETFTREMYEQCVKVNRTFGVKTTELRERTEQLEAALKEAQAEFERLRNDPNPQIRQQASRKFYRAKAALWANEERCRDEMRHFHRWLLDWGNSKRENRKGWCQALHSIAVSSRHDKATGAIVFHAFPQEVVDKIIEETGGQPIQLNLPEMPDGEIVFDESGNVFRLERVRLSGGETQDRRIFLFQVTEHGNIILDGVHAGSVQPFRIEKGSGAIRDGTVTFTNLAQRPTIRTRPALCTREDRQRFIERCVGQYGESFVVFVEGDPGSVRLLDTRGKREVFIRSAPVRPWEARSFERAQVQ